MLLAINNVTGRQESTNVKVNHSMFSAKLNM